VHQLEIKVLNIIDARCNHDVTDARCNHDVTDARCNHDVTDARCNHDIIDARCNRDIIDARCNHEVYLKPKFVNIKFKRWTLHPVTHFVDLAVEMLSVVLTENGPLRAETCRSDTVLIKWC